MKKAILFLIVLFLIGSFISGCKNSEVEELKEQVAELSEKLSEEDLTGQNEEVKELRGEEESSSIPWNEAHHHIGEMKTVYGSVLDTYYIENEDGGIWLFFDKDYSDPEGFSVWIFNTNISKFSQAPEIYYLGKNISVTGVIGEFEGSAYMEVTDQEQIEESSSIPWNEAKYHIGEIVTVYGPAVATYYDEVIDEGTTFINIGKDYPDPDGFYVWIDRYNRPNFFKAPEIYYSEKNLSVTGLIIEVDDFPQMEVTDPGQISIDKEVEEAVEKPVEEESETETDTESITEEEMEEEPVEETFTVPTIRLEVIEGPTLVEESICYYRVKAIVTGNPYPAISFNKDDSLGSLSKDISQVNLYKKGESFTLDATAMNSQGTASASITLTDTCERPIAEEKEEETATIPILIINDLGATLSLSLSGPASYSLSIPTGRQNINVIPGTYSYTGRCSGAVDSGTHDLSESGSEWRWWWQ